MSLLPVGIGSEEGGYQIERSLRFNSADSAYLSRTPAGAGNRKTWTWSAWVKRSALGTDQILFRVGVSPNPRAGLQFSSTDVLTYFGNPSGSSETAFLSTSQVFRDVSAWYHIILVLDTTQATASNRIKMYVNGSQITAFGTATYPSQNEDGAINIAAEHLIGQVSSANYLSGYLADVHFIDGSALTPSSFGETDTDTGVWQPKAYTGSYGTNGFYLDFADNTSTTTLGYDAAGSNDWTLNNFSVTAGAGNDSLVDSPTRYGTDTGAGGEVRGNYCTLNPLNGLGTISNGNLTHTNSNADHRSVAGTFGMSSGKWYWEVTLTTAGTNTSIGIAKASLSLLSTQFVGQSVDSWGYVASNGEKYNNNTNTAYGSSYNTSGTVIGVAFDADAGTLVFYRNNSSQGTAFSSLTSGPYVPAVSNYGSGLVDCNFGQRPFAYTAPSGFKALVTTNLPEPTIADGGEYFNTVLYTGTGSSLGVTGVGFQPDFVWIKERSGAADHGFYDAVRGVTKQIESNTDSAETTEATGLTAFGSDGFTVGALAQLNTSADTYVAWNWKANGAGSSNTAGTITSTVSVNTTSGFSIVIYTGTGSTATVGHGLGVAPSMIIVKRRDTGNTNWTVYHTSIGATKYLYLDGTAAAATFDFWNDTAPTSTVFSLSSNSQVNGTSMVAYCFAEVEGFSKFGSYTGNNSADGPFVFVNHRPAFVMLKRTDSTSNWTILDFAREGYNVDNDPLYPNLSNAEGTTDLADLLSNGFKLRSTDASVNASGGTYIYAAFASSPFQYSLAR